MKINRLLYFAYYLKNLDKTTFKKLLGFTIQKTGLSKMSIYRDIFFDSIRYNISILEYFQFGFYEMDSESKKKWAGTGYMYEFQKIMNPLEHRVILDDKTIFYKEYKSFFKHHVMDVKEMRKDIQGVKKMLQLSKVVLKESKGKCGIGTVFVDSDQFNPKTLIEYMVKEGFDLAETYITQHKDLNSLSPSGVNTVRIFTQLNRKDKVEILGCRQRISVNSPIDNMAAGNLAASIDEKTGIIDGPGVYSDITKSPEMNHPITNISIVGFQVPFWEDCKQLAITAALEHPENRSIGWDIVVTENGPGLIEGNHDWCKLVWQLPVKKGLKPILERHLREYKLHNV
jgi:hypothetical protein